MRHASFGAVLWAIQSGSISSAPGEYVGNRGAPFSVNETEPRIRMKRIKIILIIKKTINRRLISILPFRRVANGGAKSLNEGNNTTNLLIYKQ